MSSTDSPMEEQLFTYFLRYGMFIGAIFQLVCIAAVIILPIQIKKKNGGVYGEITDSESDGNSHFNRRTYTHHRARKQDKKKRR